MKYTATIEWNRDPSENFTRNQYSRRHRWIFDGGLELNASSSPHVVALPYSDPSAVDPEEALVASASSCHMLFFLSIAASRGFVVESYRDEAEGILEKNETGKMRMSVINLFPKIEFTGEKLPSVEEINEIHHMSHERCYIANSLNSQINVQPLETVIL
ncbi:MAG TPA: OsmC family protein [Chitinophagaceae bacterium]